VSTASATEEASSSVTSLALVAGAVWTADLLTKALASAVIPLEGFVNVDRQGWLRLWHDLHCHPGVDMPVLAHLVILALGSALAALRSHLGSVLYTAGSAGNLTSLVFGAAQTAPRTLAGVPHGCVPDWIQVGAPLTGSGPYTVFNLADVALCAGLLMAVSRRFEKPAWWPLTAAGAVGLSILGPLLHAGLG
jgi:lipoprotein signal peptidase